MTPIRSFIVVMLPSAPGRERTLGTLSLCSRRKRCFSTNLTAPLKMDKKEAVHNR
jgi:hypothetical protein